MKKLIKSILAILLFSAFTLNLYADEKVNDEWRACVIETVN